MAIRIVEDVGAPVAVFVVDKATQSMLPTWNKWINYGMTVLGYGAAYLNKGGDFTKNLAIASLPKSLDQLYALVITPAPAAVGYRVSQTQVPGFGGVKLV